MRLGVYDSVIQFTDVYRGCLNVYKKLDIDSGYYTTNKYKNFDVNRINNAKRHSLIDFKKQRNFFKAASKQKTLILKKRGYEL